MDGNVLKSIEQLRCLTVNGLREKYQEIFGENSRSGNKDYLYRRIAWRLQANAEGSLSERARRRALEIANDADLRVRAPKRIVGLDAHGIAACHRPERSSPANSRATCTS